MVMSESHKEFVGFVVVGKHRHYSHYERLVLALAYTTTGVFLCYNLPLQEVWLPVTSHY